MKIEGDYVIFTPEETSKLKYRSRGDEWSFIRNDPPQWEGLAANPDYGYGNAVGSRYMIRRLITACSPEILDQVGYGALSQHFI
jgi:hypothetical protein